MRCQCHSVMLSFCLICICALVITDNEYFASIWRIFQYGGLYFLSSRPQTDAQIFSFQEFLRESRIHGFLSCWINKAAPSGHNFTLCLAVRMDVFFLWCWLLDMLGNKTFHRVLLTFRQSTKYFSKSLGDYQSTFWQILDWLLCVFVFLGQQWLLFFLTLQWMPFLPSLLLLLNLDHWP